MRISRIAALAAALALSAPGLAFAHAHLKAASPAIDGTVKAAPTELDLTFSEALDIAFTGLTLTGPDGKAVPTDGAMLMGEDKTFMVTLPPALPAGTYVVDWHALSKDGHKTKGSYRFTVKP